ncbi:MAG TPA: RodZ domain-containing protein [Azospirillaceae bacterium]|nr:RodZ domain-containing protein [Azospirillaceae bacterium]
MIDHSPMAASSAQGPKVGELLRRRREELGQSLPQVAAALRIRQPYLEAIEESRYKDLPGQAYITGFLRSYSDHLGVDAGEVLSRFKSEMAGAPQKAELYFPEAVNENRVPGGALLMIAAVGAAVVYGGWYLLSATDRSAADMIPALPDRLAKSVEAPEGQPAPANVLPAGQVAELIGQSQPTAPEIGASSQGAATAFNTAPVSAGQQPPAAAAPAEEEGEGTGGPEEGTVPPVPDLGNPPAPAGQQTAEATTAPPPPPADTSGQPPAPAPGTPVTTPTGRVFGQTSGPARVVIRAVEDSWVEVRDGKGTNWALRTLRAGDTFRAPAVQGLTLNTGNAGGIVVSVDGKDLPALGNKGQVVRNVQLDPERLTGAAPATPPAR